MDNALCVRTFAEMRRDVCDDKLYIVDIEDMHMDIDKSLPDLRPFFAIGTQ